MLQPEKFSMTELYPKMYEYFHVLCFVIFFIVFVSFFRSQGLTQVPRVLDNCSSKVGVSQLPALLGEKHLEWVASEACNVIFQCYEWQLSVLQMEKGSRAQHIDKERGTTDFHR